MKRWKKYKVKRGRHRSVKGGLKMYWGKRSLDFKFIVDDSWFWKDKNGVSKVYGLSVGTHKKNSMRLGFKCVDGIPTAYAYSYANGKRRIEKMCSLTLGEFACHISVKDSKWHIKVYRVADHGLCEIGNASHPFWHKRVFGYRLNPYIGGNYTLNHDWTVRIKEL